MQIYTIISIILILFILSIWYKFYYHPKKIMKYYYTILTNLGYKVYQSQFIFLGISTLYNSIKYYQQKGDATYLQKKQYSKVDIVIQNILNKIIINFINPELLKQFWSIEGNNRYIKEQILILASKQIFGEGMIFSQRQIWKKKRKIISNLFNFDLLKENIYQIKNISNRWFQEFDQKYQLSNGKIQYNPLGIGIRIFNGVIMKCFLGCQQVNQKVRGESFEEFTRKLFENVQNLLKDPILLLLGKFAYKYGLSKSIRKAKEQAAIFRSICRQISKRRKEQVLKQAKPQRYSDILQAIIHEGKDIEYSDQELLDQFSTFIVAGTDTTTRFFTMMIYYIAKYPQIQKKLRQQIGQFIKNQDELTFQNIKKIIYLDWIQNQTLRHYGPVNGQFFRYAEEDSYIKDIPIQKGTVLTSQTMGNHYNPTYFKDPYTFRPQRWESQCNDLPGFAFTGFLGGPRTCIGKHLALLQTKITIIKIILRYKQLSLPEDTNIKIKLQFIHEPTPFEVIFSK